MAKEVVKKKEAKVSMVDLIRQKVEQSAGTGMIFLKVKDKEKRKVRVLTELDDVVVVSFHDSYKFGVNQPCYKYFGKKTCPLCDKTKDDGFRTRDIFMFSVYDYESKEVKIMAEAANDCSPLPAMLDFYETHGTMCDRDYTISRRGKSFDTSYTLIPGDKSKFRGKDINGLDEDEVFDKLKERYLSKMKDVLKKIKNGTLEIEVNKEDEEEEEEKVVSKKKKENN